MSRLLKIAVGMAALCAVAAPAAARPLSGHYICAGSQGPDLIVEILDEGCIVDGEVTAEAGTRPLACHSPPPVIRAFTLFDDMTYTYDPGNSAFGSGDGAEAPDPTTLNENHVGVCNPA